MKKPTSTFQKTVASALCAALITPFTPAPALANVVAAANPGKAAMTGGSAGASVRAVTVVPKLGALSVGTDMSFQTSLPDAGSLNPISFSLAPGLQFVPAGSEKVMPARTAVAVPTNGSAAPLPAKTQSSLEAASPAQGAETVPSGKFAAPLRRVFSSLGKALRLGRSSRFFDGGRKGGVGILPDESRNSENDLDLDPRPEQPENTETPRLTWNRVHFPGQLGQPTATGRIFRGSSIRPIALPGNPRTAAGVEGALRKLIGENAREFGGITPDQLETVLANKVEGREGLAGALYVNFRQRLQTLPVDGSYLNFTVKLIGGQAVLVGSAAQLFPSLEVDAFGRLSDEQILERAFDRLGRPTGSYDDLNKIGRRVMHLGGRWRSVYLVLSNSETLMAAVDVNTGETFAWDPRMSAEVGGRAEGRGVEFDPGATGDKLDVMPMAHAEVTTSDGRIFHTDGGGYFTLDAVSNDAPVTVTARLKGRYAQVQDQQKANLTVAAVAKPGETIQLLFNPEGIDENSIAQVNAYRHVTKVHDWMAAEGITDAIDRSIPVKPNMRRDCNAYYTPWSPSLNFFSRSERCANTSFDSVVYHEYGHFVDDMLGGIVNGGLSEGWGDILSMYITGTPEIGRGFLLGRDVSWIRDGRNKYQYRGSDEVHKQGEAWGGFAWKLRDALIASFKDAGLADAEANARGAALANALVIPVFFANVRDIPQAIEAVLMRDVGADGRAAHFKEIAAAAAAHGIKLKEPRPGEVATLRTRTRGRFLGAVSRLAQRLARITRTFANRR